MAIDTTTHRFARCMVAIAQHSLSAEESEPFLAQNGWPRSCEGVFRQGEQDLPLGVALNTVLNEFN